MKIGSALKSASPRKMKQFFAPHPRRRSCRGFSLVEAVLSIGMMSFGFLAMAPLLGLGITSARLPRENRATAQIATTLIEQAKQGTAFTTPYFDSTSSPSTATQAAYFVQETTTTFAPGSVGSGPLSRLCLRIAPVASVGGARTYADVYPTPPAP